jgi:hypothetical protein
MTLTIKGLFATLSIMAQYIECIYAEFHYAECRYAVYHIQLEMAQLLNEPFKLWKNVFYMTEAEISWRQDIQHNSSQHNDTHHEGFICDTQHNDTI